MASRIEKDISLLGEQRTALIDALDTVTDDLKEVVVRAVTEGVVSEVQASRLSGVSRNSIRAWLGKT